MIEWTHVLIAFIAGLPAAIAAVGALIATLRNGNKADTLQTSMNHNTAITRAGTAATKIAVEGMDRKLNGGVDGAIEAAIRPLRDAIADQVSQNEANMREVRAALSDLRGRIKN